MLVEIEDNPNTRGCDQFVFAEIGPAKRLKAIRAEERGVEVIYAVGGVKAGGGFCPAFATKINDSSDGFAFLITGGEWGIRLRPEAPEEPWDLANPRQWGEPFKIYGSESDLVYE